VQEEKESFGGNLMRNENGCGISIGGFGIRGSVNL
jgi:hypothetical protein